MNIDVIRSYVRTEILRDPELEIAADQDLLLTGMLDSLAVFRLVTHLEETFDIKVRPEDVTLEHFSSLARIEAYVRSRRS